MSPRLLVTHARRASKLEILVANAWRAVRWAHCGGSAICDTCYDGVDLRPIKADPRNPTLRRYACHSCQRIVTDWSDTWLAPLKAPLARWAWLVLYEALNHGVGPEIMGRQINLRHHTIRGMRDKLATAPERFLAEWRQALLAQGVTLVKLTAALLASRPKAEGRNPLT